MRKYIEGIRNLPYAMLAAATVSVATTGTALAQGEAKSFGATAKDLTGQAADVGKLIVAGTFIGGLVMLGTGLMKLKQAAENPNQTKYSEGLWRCGVGAAMVAIPSFSGSLSKTFGWDTPSISPFSGAGGV